MIPSSKDLGLAIAHLRGERTQAEVAKRAGIDPPTWSLYEAGKRRPREQSLEKVLRGLLCSRLELEETTWRMRRQRLVSEERIKAEEAALASPVSEAGPGPRVPPRNRVPAEPRRRELRALVARFSASLEELLAFMLREDW